MTCIGNCNMHPILNACSFLAGRLEEEAARPGCIKTPARCTARAELQLQNMADHGHHNATEADHITTLGGREGRLNHRPQTNRRTTSVSLPKGSFRVCGCKIAWPSRWRFSPLLRELKH